MTRKGADNTSGRTPGMMLSIFLLLLAAYLIYIMLLHPWERKELLTKKSNITINVVDCESGYPIDDAHIYIYNEQGHLIKDVVTDDSGQVVYEDFPDCFQIKASFTDELYEGVCIGSGEQKVVNFCYEYPSASPNVIYYTENIGVVGGTSGEVVSEKEFDNIVLSFPLSNATINYPSYYLYSNILWSEGMGINLTKINEELTKSVEFQFILQSKKGNPTLSVRANDKILYNDKAVPGELVSLSIPRQEISENINVEVKCDFDGWMFWTTQDCNITDIKAIQEFYTPRLTSKSFNFSASGAELKSENVELRFINTIESPGGIKASVNGIDLFDSNSLLAKNYSASINTQLLSLESAGNQLVIEANPSADIYLRGVKLSFTTAVTDSTEKELNFYITEEELNKMDRGYLNFFVENVYLNGTLKFKLNNVFYTAVIEKGGWNKVKMLKGDLVEDENNLLVTAPEGRFEIDELKITYE